MKLQYLGTAAAEAFPALFCHCDVCRRARENGGRDIRCRSGLVINDTTLIDFPPDIYFTSLRFGLDLGDVTDVLVTHSHLDHFDCAELGMRYNGMYCHLPSDRPNIRVYGNDGVEAVAENYRDDHIRAQHFMDFTRIEPGKTFTIPNGLCFTALPARHKPDEQALFFMVTDGDKHILYANDTGVFLEEAYELLRGIPLDFVSLDCCFGKISCGVCGHMGMPENAEVIGRLKDIGCIQEHTICVAHHFSHNCGQLHEELEAEAARYGMQVSYDGRIFIL